MESIFPYQLYTDDDPYYSIMPGTSSYCNDMPTSDYWKNRFHQPKLDLSDQSSINIYSQEDSYYNSMLAHSKYEDNLPSSAYWIQYTKDKDIKKIEKESKPEPKMFKREFKIGYIILMNLGGKSNPEFMNSQDNFTTPKDLNDGAGLAYVLDEQLQKYRPVIRRRDRYIPHEQKVDIIDMYPSKNQILDDKIEFGEARSDLGHSNFCSQKLIETLFNKKELFKPFSEDSFQNARKKANQYENISKAIFMNRAAVKIANIDFLYNLTNTSMFNKPSASDVPPDEYFYFADICAGPGGFTDYLYWRLGEDRARGFGMTLAGDHDWAPNYKFLRDVRTFMRSYGSDGTGNIFKIGNLVEFRNLIESRTNGEMVSLVTADGGIAVDGQENDQEMLLKRLVMCQFFCALTILRKGGNFVCKVFDVLTDFSSSLLYIVAQCFNKFSIVKPYTSRPANNERYCIFLDLRETFPEDVINLLSNANDEFQNIEDYKQSEVDIMSLFPIGQIPKYFAEYLLKSNEELIKAQIEAVDELICYAEDPSMKPLDQDDIARRCLKEWCVPRNKMEDTDYYHKRYRSIRSQPTQHELPQRQQQQQQQEEEPEEEGDRRTTSLGSIIMMHKNRLRHQKGEIVRIDFRSNESNQNQSSTYFSFV